MEKPYSLLFSSLPGELIAAIVIYIAGYATNELFDRLNQKHRISILTHQTEIAFKAIEMAEQKFPGEGNGSKKLDLATRYLMDKGRIKRYEEARSLILQCFPLTRLSHD